MELTALLCDVCNKVFKNKKTLTEHKKKVHKIGSPFRNLICPVTNCNHHVRNNSLLREHLSRHGINIEVEKLFFGSKQDFYQWKDLLEVGNKFSYTLCTTYHLQNGTKKLCYSCNRSGTFNSESTGRRALKIEGSCKIGVTCPARMEVVEKESIEVIHYKTHVGHARKDQFSKEELAKITSKEVSFEKLLKDLGNEKPVDLKLHPGKKKYINWIKHAYAAEEYNTELSDNDCVSQWVQNCCQMEEIPVLLCLRENAGCENEKFILVIMTEFQKHIFLSSSKHLICVDSFHCGCYLQLVVVLVMDDLNTAFPVAYCITKKLNKDTMTKFFACIKESTGNISFKYFMSHSLPYIYDVWVEVMGNSPQWLWNRWHIINLIRNHLRKDITENETNKYELLKMIMSLMNCQSKDIFICVFKNFVNILQEDEKLKKLGKWIMEKLANNNEKWANCYRKDINFLTHIEVIHEIFINCCTMGKGKRLYTFISVLMNVLKNKILDLIVNSFDDLKIGLAVNAINLCHKQGMHISLSQISPISDKLWKIDSEDSIEYVTLEMEKCPDCCSLRCIECNICVHQYSCSCVYNMIDANLCMHIHAVVFLLLDTHKDLPLSPTKSLTKNIPEDYAFATDKLYFPIQPSPVLSTSQTLIPSYINMPDYISMQSECNSSTKQTELLPITVSTSSQNLNPLQSALSKTMEVYHSIQMQKWDKESLNTITDHLNDLLNIINDKSESLVTISTESTNTIIVSKQSAILDCPSSEQSYKRPAPLLEANKPKILKTNDSWTHSPHVLVLSNNVIN